MANEPVTIHNETTRRTVTLPARTAAAYLKLGGWKKGPAPKRGKKQED